MTHVVHTELIESLGDLDLLLGIEESVGELLTLTQSRLNDLEAGDIAQEIGDADIVAVRVAGGGRVGVLASLNASESFVAWREVSGQFKINACHSILSPLAPLVCPLGSGSAPGHIVCVVGDCVWWGRSRDEDLLEYGKNKSYGSKYRIQNYADIYLF